MKINKLKSVPFPEELMVAETDNMNLRCPKPSNCKKSLSRFIYNKKQYIIYIIKND